MTQLKIAGSVTRILNMITKKKLRKMIQAKDPKALPHLLEELRKRPRIEPRRRITCGDKYKHEDL